MIARRYSKLIKENPEKFADLNKALVGARIPMTLQRYLTLAFKISVVSGILGIILGFYLLTFVIPFSSITPYLANLIPPMFIVRNFKILSLCYSIIGSLLFGLLLFKLSFYLITLYPSFVSARRRHEIELYLPHAVNMMFGMATGGVRIYDIIKCIAESRVMCGELSREFKVAVDLIENFRHDLFEALKFVRDTTPSDKLAAFLDDLIFVLSGGGKLTEFLKGKSEELLEEQEVSFDSYIDFLGIMAEVYLAVFVLLPLFLLIVLVVMQLIGENVMNLYRIAMAVVLPLATISFIFLIRSSLPVPRVRVEEMLDEREIPIISVKSTKAKSFRINKVKRTFVKIKRIVLYPFKERSIYTLKLKYLTFHFALIGTLTFLISSRFLNLERSLVLAVSAVVIPLIVLVELKTRTIRKIEERVPDMFRELSVLNEAGLNILEALKVLSTSETGIMSKEISIVRRRIEWGTTVHKAFNIFGSRVKSDIIMKIIPIVSKALEVSPSFKDAFITVARFADAEVRFAKRVRNYMFTYIVITYMSIFIFLFVVYIVITSFFSAFSVNVTAAAISFTLNIESIKDIFFQMSVLVGLLSGIIAGVIGEGKIESGLKHSYVFLMATYIVFRVLLR